MAFSLSVPDEYLCPITRDLMKNPITLIEDGYAYEEHALQAWLKDHNTSPMTNRELKSRQFTPNRPLKSLIENFCQQYGSIASSDNFFAFDYRVGVKFSGDWEARPRIQIKISLLGSMDVGKTNLALAFEHGRVPPNLRLSPSTIGVDTRFFHLDRLFQDQYVVSIRLYDVSGQDRYEAVVNQYFRGCHGAFLLVNPKDPKSLERLIAYWYSTLEKLAMDNVQTILVSAKSDLIQKEDNDYPYSFMRQAENFASRHQMPIMQVSSHVGDNVGHLFRQMITRIMSNQALVQDLIAKAVHVTPTKVSKKQSCSC